MSKKRKRRRYRLTTLGKITLVLIIIIIILIFYLVFKLVNKPEQQITVTPTPAVVETLTPSVDVQPSEVPQESYDTASYDSLTVIANKKHSIGTYEPSDLVAVDYPGANGTQYMRQEAANAFATMAQAAREDGVNIYSLSGYRSYYTQQSLYQTYADRDGSAAADTYSSRAGYSDHQTGLAIDISGDNTRLNASDRSDCPYDQCEGSPASLWLEQHAHEYGFIIRFPQGKQDITGYVYEWWHYRYVGIDLATKIKESGLCMEEYFNVEGGDYE